VYDFRQCDKSVQKVDSGFFIDSNGTSIPVTHRLTQNDPSKVIACVPGLSAGSYTLRIVTKDATNRQKVLKNALVAEYTILFIVS